MCESDYIAYRKIHFLVSAVRIYSLVLCAFPRDPAHTRHAVLIGCGFWLTLTTWLQN